MVDVVGVVAVVAVVDEVADDSTLVWLVVEEVLVIGIVVVEVEGIIVVVVMGAEAFMIDK